MRRLAFIAFLILILSVISVNAVSNFNIIEDHVNISGTAGQTLSSSFIANNNGTKNLNISFTGYTLTKGSDQITISSLGNITGVDNGTNQSASFSVVLPGSQSSGLYTGTLTATSNLSDTDTMAINVNVTRSYIVSTNVSEIDLRSISLNTNNTQDFNITNTGNSNITNVSFDFSESGFQLKSNKTNFMLLFNSSEIIRFNITIPKTSSTGNVTLGSVKIVSTELNKSLFNVKASVGGGLIIEDLDIFLTTRKSKSGNHLDVGDGKRLDFGTEDAGPGSELKFNLNIENAFKDDDNIDIEDITVTITIEDIDDGDDIVEESDNFKVNSGKDEEVDVFVNIPLSVDRATYPVVIEVEGEDEEGNTHTKKMNLKLRINKENRAVVVGKAYLFPGEVKCSGTSTLTAMIKNIGERTEKDAKIEIINSDLGINFAKDNIELEHDPFSDDNEFTKKLTVNIDSSTGAGKYPIKVKSHIQEGAVWETKTVNLEVEACDKVAEEEPEEEQKEEKTEGEETKEAAEEAVTETRESEKIPVLQPETTIEAPFTKTSGFWIAMAILNIIVVAVVTFLIVNMIRKRESKD